MAKKVKVTAMPNSAVIANAETLGQLIKAKRTQHGIKMVDCAALCGVGINTLSRIENGNANCTLAAVFAVLRGLGIQLTATELTSEVSASPAESSWV